MLRSGISAEAAAGSVGPICPIFADKAGAAAMSLFELPVNNLAGDAHTAI